MLKIAQFIDSLDPGGAETLVLELSKRISTYGFEPEIIHFGNTWLQQKAKQLGITCVEAPAHRYFRSVRTLPFFALAFARFLQERHVDLIHSHLYGAVVGASLGSVLRCLPNVGTLHDTYTIEERPSRFLLVQMASLLRTTLVVVSDDMRRHLNRIPKLYRPHLTKVFNGVDLGTFRASSDPALRTTMRLRSNDMVLISVGRLVRIKRYDILIKALAELKDNALVRLFIVGDGPCRESIEQLIANCGLQQRAQVLGFRDDVPRLLAMSDCFVLASDSEGLSYSIVESMAAGLPAVVTDVGGNSELVKHGESGYLVSKGDRAMFAEHIHQLIIDPVKRRSFGERARQRAQLYFSIDKTVEQYIQLYRQVVGDQNEQRSNG